MYVAEIIYPEDAPATISCDSCNCDYGVEDYEVLFENNKIKYFKVRSTFVLSDNSLFLCHDCLLESAKTIAEGGKTTFIIQAEKNEYIVEFTPEDEDEDQEPIYGDDDEEGGEDGMDGFLKDLE